MEVSALVKTSWLPPGSQPKLKTMQSALFGSANLSISLWLVQITSLISENPCSERFAFVDYNEDSPFKWLQAVDEPALALPVTIPAYFGIPYQFTIPDEKEKVLEAKDASDILALTIANVPNGAPQNTTVNLLAPIVINTTNKRAIQLILTNTDYSVKHKIFDNKEQ